MGLKSRTIVNQYTKRRKEEISPKLAFAIRNTLALAIAV
jgi:hypothetical protein